MQEFGCHTLDGHAFGDAGGIPFSAQLQPQPGGDTEILLHFASGQSTRALASRLNKEKPAHVRWFSQQDKDGYALVAIFRPPSDFYAKSGIFKLMHQMTALQQAGDFAPPDTCPLCGLGGTDANACLSEVYRPVHAACVNTRLELPEKDEIIPAAAGGHVITGILGALLGAFIGALPIFTFALNDGTIHWVLYAFIPILSGLCYRLLRGRASSGLAGLSVLLASLLAAFGLELIWFWLVLSNEYGQTIPFIVSTQRYFASHNLGTTLREMLTCLLALFAGYMAITVFLRRYVREGVVPKHMVRGAAFVRGSMAPPKPAGEPEKPAEAEQEEPETGTNETE